MKKLKEETEKNTNKNIFKVLKIVGLIIVAIFILEIWMVNRLSTYGSEIQNLNQLKSSLEIENQLLQSQIAQNSSLSHLETLASKMGFVSIMKLEHLKTEGLASAR